MAFLRRKRNIEYFLLLEISRYDTRSISSRHSKIDDHRITICSVRYVRFVSEKKISTVLTVWAITTGDGVWHDKENVIRRIEILARAREVEYIRRRIHIHYTRPVSLGFFKFKYCRSVSTIPKSLNEPYGSSLSVNWVAKADKTRFARRTNLRFISLPLTAK